MTRLICQIKFQNLDNVGLVIHFESEMDSLV